MPIYRTACLLVLLCALALPLLAREESPDASSWVTVPGDRILQDDGDSFAIRWDDEVEVVRILGIDAPEVRHLEHDIPFDQPFGERAAGFMAGCLAVAHEVRLLRSGERDPYGRTLGYLFLDGRNYSVLAVAARLAVENVSHFGDNGLPDPAAAVRAAAADAGPVPFEAPHRYRGRMRELSSWMKANGTYPGADPDADAASR